MGGMLSRGFNPETDIPDMSGKVVLVTGGNAGIGYAVVTQLVRCGAKVYMGARNENKAKAAIDQLLAEGTDPGNGEVVWLDLDLSDPFKVQKAADQFMEKEKRLDVLINNAAALYVPYAKDYYHLQNIIMVNYLGTLILTRSLLPLLRRTAIEPNSDVRVVCVNSITHEYCPSGVRFRTLDDLNRSFEDTMFPQYFRYALSKAMQLMFVKDLQQRLDEQAVPIICMGLDPGEVNTDGAQEYTHTVGPVLGPLYRVILATYFLSPAQGARSTLFCAGSSLPRADPAKYRGAYLDKNSRVVPCSKLVANADLRAELAQTTAKFLLGLGLQGLPW